MAPEIDGATFENISGDRDIYLAKGDVVIPVDVTWNLVAPVHVVASAETVVVDYDYGVSDKIDLIVEGLLNTDSTDSADSVYFRPEMPNNDSAEEWGGVYIAWARNGPSIKYANFSYAENPLYVYYADSLTTIRHCSFHHFADTGLWMRETMGQGAVVDSNSFYRGDSQAVLNVSLGRVGVVLDGTDELTFSGNKLWMQKDGLDDLDTDYSRAIEIYFGKNKCMESGGSARTLSVEGNTLEGPGASHPLLVGGVSGIYSNYACGGGGRTVEIMENWITGFNYAGLEFSQSSDVQVSCNSVKFNREAVNFFRDSEPTGVGVRFGTNLLEADEDGFVVVQTTNARMIKMGPYTGARGHNQLATAGLTRTVYEDEPGNSHWPLDVTDDRWLKDGDQLADSAAVVADSLVWTTLADSVTSNLPYYVISPLWTVEAGSHCWPDSGSGPTQVQRNFAQAIAEPPETVGRKAAPPEEAEVTAVQEALPLLTSVGRPFPNPTRRSVGINLAVSADHEGTFRAEVFNVAGRSVALLVDRRLGPGRYQLEWSGSDRAGARVAPGIYFLRVTGPGIRTNAKIVMIR